MRRSAHLALAVALTGHLMLQSASYFPSSFVTRRTFQQHASGDTPRTFLASKKVSSTSLKATKKGATAADVNVREIYNEWCERCNKVQDEKRYKVFCKNYATMERITKGSTGIKDFGPYADCTWEEYEPFHTGIGSDLNSIKVKELKEVCKKCNIIRTGKKAELVERIQMAWMVTDEEIVDSSFLPASKPPEPAVKNLKEKEVFDLPANLSKLKVKELKAECKKRSIPCSGTKAVLIQRLKDATTPTNDVEVVEIQDEAIEKGPEPADSRVLEAGEKLIEGILQAEQSAEEETDEQIPVDFAETAADEDVAQETLEDFLQEEAGAVESEISTEGSCLELEDETTTDYEASVMAEEILLGEDSVAVETDLLQAEKSAAVETDGRIDIAETAADEDVAMETLEDFLHEEAGALESELSTDGSYLELDDESIAEEESVMVEEILQGDEPEAVETDLATAETTAQDVTGTEPWQEDQAETPEADLSTDVEQKKPESMLPGEEKPKADLFEELIDLAGTAGDLAGTALQRMLEEQAELTKLRKAEEAERLAVQKAEAEKEYQRRQEEEEKRRLRQEKEVAAELAAREEERKARQAKQEEEARQREEERKARRAQQEEQARKLQEQLELEAIAAAKAEAAAAARMREMEAAAKRMELDVSQSPEIRAIPEVALTVEESEKETISNVDKALDEPSLSPEEEREARRKKHEEEARKRLEQQEAAAIAAAKKEEKAQARVAARARAMEEAAARIAAEKEAAREEERRRRQAKQEEEAQKRQKQLEATAKSRAVEAVWEKSPKASEKQSVEKEIVEPSQEIQQKPDIWKLKAQQKAAEALAARLEDRNARRTKQGEEARLRREQLEAEAIIAAKSEAEAAAAKARASEQILAKHRERIEQTMLEPPKGLAAAKAAFLKAKQEAEELRAKQEAERTRRRAKQAEDQRKRREACEAEAIAAAKAEAEKQAAIAARLRAMEENVDRPKTKSLDAISISTDTEEKAGEAPQPQSSTVPEKAPSLGIFSSLFKMSSPSTPKAKPTEEQGTKSSDSPAKASMNQSLVAESAPSKTLDAKTAVLTAKEEAEALIAWKEQEAAKALAAREAERKERRSKQEEEERKWRAALEAEAIASAKAEAEEQAAIAAKQEKEERKRREALEAEAIAAAKADAEAAALKAKEEAEARRAREQQAAAEALAAREAERNQRRAKQEEEERRWREALEAEAIASARAEAEKQAAIAAKQAEDERKRREACEAEAIAAIKAEAAKENVDGPKTESLDSVSISVDTDDKAEEAPKPQSITAPEKTPSLGIFSSIFKMSSAAPPKANPIKQQGTKKSDTPAEALTAWKEQEAAKTLAAREAEHKQRRAKQEEEERKWRDALEAEAIATAKAEAEKEAARIRVIETGGNPDDAKLEDAASLATNAETEVGEAPESSGNVLPDKRMGEKPPVKHTFNVFSPVFKMSAPKENLSGKDAVSANDSDSC